MDGEIRGVDAVAEDDRALVFARAHVVEDFELGLVANDQVDAGNGRNRRRPGLGVTADDGGEGFGVFPDELADEFAALRVGFTRDGAGVDNAQISRFAEGHDAVAGGFQPVGQHFGFRLIQTASERLHTGPFHARNEGAELRGVQASNLFFERFEGLRKDCFDLVRQEDKLFDVARIRGKFECLGEL